MVSDRWQLCVCSTVNGTWVSFTFITAGLLFDMETFLIVNKRFFDHIVESAEGSVTTLSLWGFFFLSIVNHLAVFGSSCSVTYVTLLSFSYRNFKQSERSRNDLDRVTTKRASEHQRERAAPDAESFFLPSLLLLSAQLHPAPGALKAAAEGRTQRTIWAQSSREALHLRYRASLFTQHPAAHTLVYSGLSLLWGLCIDIRLVSLRPRRTRSPVLYPHSPVSDVEKKSGIFFFLSYIGLKLILLVSTESIPVHWIGFLCTD